MSDIQIINKSEAKSATRKVVELSLTTAVWALWLYLLLPILNILMWIIGLASISTELFEKGGHLVFINLVQQMGLVILITFTIMRLWGIYNYYRFGRHERRSHETPDSMEKLSRYFQLEPAALAHLETRKEIIWPHKDDSEDPGAWLQNKSENLTPEQLNQDEGNILMRFHDVSGTSVPSISKSALISLLFVIALAAALLFTVGGFQKKADMTASQITSTEAVAPEAVAPEAVAPTSAIQPGPQ